MEPRPLFKSFHHEGSCCRLTAEQQDKLTAWITATLPRTTRQVGAWIEAEFAIDYQTRSGLIALLHRLGMEHRKPKTISRKLDPVKQAGFIKEYEARMNQLAADEAVIFVDAAHPTHTVRPVGCWAPKDVPVAVEQSSGRDRLNIHGAINLETGQTIIAGMGELHLEIIRDRLKREFSVEADAGAPQIAYRETITKSAEGEGKFIRQSGGRGQYGHAVVDVEPNEKGKGVEILNKVVGGTIPKEYIPAVMNGIAEAIKSGVYAGFQVIDIKVSVKDGSFHEVDSNELAFKMAGIFALKDAFAQAGPILLEPIMKVEATTPDEYQGDILGDINRRRGMIQGVDAKNGQTVLTAQVPLAEMFGYSTSLRSMSQGRANYVMEFSHYAEVPKNVLETIKEKQGK